MSQGSKIAIIGAGNVGTSLGINLARHGYPLRFGVREGADVKEVLAKCEGRAEASSVSAAAQWADVIFLAVPAAAAEEAVRALGEVKGKVLVDCTNPVAWGNDGPRLAPTPQGSVAAALAQAFPGLRVVKGFSTFGAEFHLDPRVGDTSVDVQLAGDDAEAKALVSAIATKAGFTPIDVGPLRNAALLESLAVLWIHLAMKGGQGRHVAFKLLKRG
ncbi:NAD(P)-binding domain-containing protein [Archangium gephyra]|uniref:NADPH-dependent F420 reductase n=1 Tax=Archangium gephyra TaxID=48 RepID=UPI0035D44614